jgi:hypothetical protein
MSLAEAITSNDFSPNERRAPYLNGAAAPLLEPAAPAPTEERSTDGAPLLNPGFNLTLRPMRYPGFLRDVQSNAIRNTWTVEEVDFSRWTSPTSRTSLEPGRAAPHQRLVAFFATGDSIVSNNLVLNLYSTSTRPRRGCTCRGSSTRRRCTCSSTSPCSTPTCPTRGAAAGVRGVENIPSIQPEGRVLLQVDGLDPVAGSPAGPRRTASAVLAEPHLLRGLHRGAVLLRRLRLRVLPALARAAARAGRRAPTGCSATRAMHMAFAFEVIRTGA